MAKETTTKTKFWFLFSSDLFLFLFLSLFNLFKIKANNYKATPFGLLADIIKLLGNDKRVDTNQANCDDMTPFYISCQGGQIETVKLLLNDKRIDVKANINGVTPFWIACQKNILK